jgi:aminotransferase
MADLSAFGAADDTAFARRLIEEAGVGGVPGSSFYRDPHDGRHQLRFAFPKQSETLAGVRRRLVTHAPVRRA